MPHPDPSGPAEMPHLPAVVPESAEAVPLNRRAVDLAQHGQLDEALALLDRALTLDPGLAEAHNNRGNVLLARGKADEARAAYQEALRLRPDYAKAHGNLGNLFLGQGQGAAAVACYREAVRCQPGDAEANNHLGQALAEQGNWAEAEAHYRRAIRRRPDYADAHYNLGRALIEYGQFAAALTSFHHALRAQPEHVEAHWGRALTWLTLGDFRRGWPEYEWRWKRSGATPRSFAQPVWDGSPLEGRTILLHAEQGLGDTLQFIRYAPLVRQAGGLVVVEAPRPLLALLARTPGIDRVAPLGGALAGFDVHAPLLSLPGLFGTTLETVPANVPYLVAPAEAVERWRGELAGGGLKVGIAWQGNPQHRRDRHRSVPLAQFAPLARVAGVRLVSLQKGPGADQLAECPFPVVDVGGRLDAAAGFLDTAGVLAHLDLVVTADTAVAHLAGALGVAVWVALPYVPDWRWLVGREDSPWYPSLRLFRQERQGDWDGVFRRMAQALRSNPAVSSP